MARSSAAVAVVASHSSTDAVAAASVPSVDPAPAAVQETPVSSSSTAAAVTGQPEWPSRPVRVGASSDVAKVAAYITRVLHAHTPAQAPNDGSAAPRTLLVSAVGANAGARAVHVIARATAMLWEMSEGGLLLSVQPRAIKLPPRDLESSTPEGDDAAAVAEGATDSGSGGGAADGDDGNDAEAREAAASPRSRSRFDVFITAEPPESFADKGDAARSGRGKRVVLTTTTDDLVERTRKGVERLMQNSGNEGSSNSSSAAAAAVVPSPHVTTWRASGPPAAMALLLGGLARARRELRPQGSDLRFILWRRVQEVPQRTPGRSSGGSTAATAAEHDGGDGGGGDDTAEVGGTAADDATNDASGVQEGGKDAPVFYRVSTYVAAYRVPVQGTVAAAAQLPPGTGEARPSRPGFVEVPEAEWTALREQLDMVPLLTEQLQVMTQQHEQLLLLLEERRRKQQ